MEEILNNWLQEKPKDKFDKELHKYTYYDLMEFAEHYHTLQLQQTGVIASCSNAYIGKEFVYTSRITNCKTIFKVARTDDRYGQTILISENKNRYFLSDVIPHN